MGTATNPTAILAATEISLFRPNEIWHDNAPDATVELSSELEEHIITEDIIFTVATESIAGGVLDFYAMYYPLGESSSVVAA